LIRDRGSARFCNPTRSTAGRLRRAEIPPPESFQAAGQILPESSGNRGLWAQGKLVNKIASSFTSAATLHGGAGEYDHRAQQYVLSLGRNHRLTRVFGADQSIGIKDAALFKHAFGQILKIDLMADANAGRHDVEAAEGLLSLLEELIPFAVAFELHLHIQFERIRAVPVINLHRMINHQINRHERFDELRIAAQPHNGGTPCGEISQQRHTGESLEQNAGDDEGNLTGAFSLGRPGGQRPHVIFGNALTVEIAQHRFEHDAQADRQRRNRTEPFAFKLRILSPTRSHWVAKALAGTTVEWDDAGKNSRSAHRLKLPRFRAEVSRMVF
jgi:hypothetical protein